MADFRRSSKPRNYLSRREQRRLLLLVMSLGLLVVLIVQAGKPESWRWLVGQRGSENQRARPAPAAKAPFDNRPKSASSPPGSHEPSRSPDAAEAEEDPTGRYFPGVKPELLQAIRDNSPLFSVEHPAWFNLLDVLNRADETTLEKRSKGRITHAQLYSQPKEYRGELVTIKGIVRRAFPIFPARENDVGIEGYYRLWCFPDDNPKRVIVVYSLYLPEGFPTGKNLESKVEITGFFFKRWIYGAGENDESLRIEPLMLSRTVVWEKPPSRAGGIDSNTMWWMFGGALTIGLSAALYVYYHTRPARATGPETPPNFDALRDADVPSDAGPPRETPADWKPPE